MRKGPFIKGVILVDGIGWMVARDGGETPVGVYVWHSIFADILRAVPRSSRLRRYFFGAAGG
jgi:hypothetical protein